MEYSAITVDYFLCLDKDDEGGETLVLFEVCGGDFNNEFSKLNRKLRGRYKAH